MALTKIEKELIEEKFRGVHQKMDMVDANITEKLENIIDFQENIREYISKEKQRFIDCPNTESIQKLNEELSPLRVIIKYPKTFIVGCFIFGAAIVLSFLKTIGIDVF